MPGNSDVIGVVFCVRAASFSYFCLTANVKRAMAGILPRSMMTVALLGYDGGEVVRRQLADFPIVVRCDYIPRIQEVQASIYHAMREAMEAALRD